jgi:hypothetical protein
MGDGGLSTGAALAEYFSKNKKIKKKDLICT